MTRTGALALPRTMPFCGMPASMALDSRAPATEPDDALVAAVFAPEPDVETAMSTATAIAATPSTPPSRMRRRRRAAAAATAASRSTRARRAASRRCSRVGWAAAGIVKVLLRAMSGERGRVRSAGTTDRRASRPQSASGGVRPRRTAARQGDGDQEAAARARPEGGPAAEDGARGGAPARARDAPCDADQPLGADVPAGREQQEQQQRRSGGERVRIERDEAMRDDDRHEGGGHRAQEKPVADAHDEPA